MEPIERAVQDFAAYGYEVLCDLRDNSKPEHRTEDFFEKLLPPEGYEIWNALRFEREARDYGNGRTGTALVIKNGSQPIYAVDPSDTYVSTLSRGQFAKFKQQQQQLRMHGMWIDLPSFSNIQSDTKRRELREQSPSYGRIPILAPGHYFNLAYCQFEDQAAGQTIWSNYNRRSAMLYFTWWIARNYPLHLSGGNRENMFVFKPRGVRFTRDRWGDDFNDFTLPRPFTCITVMDNNPKVKDEHAEMVDFLKNYTPAWIKQMGVGEDKEYGGVKDKGANTQGKAQIEFRYLDPESGQVKSNKIHIINDQPKNVERYRATRVRLEEAGLYETEVYKIVSKAGKTMVDAQNQQVGFLSGGGVIDKSNPNEKHLNKILRNPRANGYFVLFIGKQHHLDADPVTGKADEDGIIETVMQKRRELYEAGAFEQLEERMRTDAITTDDCFHVSGAQRLDMARLHLQLREAQVKIEDPSNDISITHGWFQPNYSNFLQPIWSPNPQGGWRILQHPGNIERNGRPKKDFVGGADNLNETVTPEEAADARKNIGKRSQFAHVILNMHTGQPVAAYLYRHPDPREDYMQTLLATLYYNCYFFPETNKEGNRDFFYDYEAPGCPPGYFAKWCYPTPHRYNTKSTQARRVGMKTGQNKKALYEEYFVPYFEQHVEDIYHPSILDAAYKWDIDDKNTTPDMGMALLMALIAKADIEGGHGMTIEEEKSQIDKLLQIAETYHKWKYKT